MRNLFTNYFEKFFSLLIFANILWGIFCSPLLFAEEAEATAPVQQEAQATEPAADVAVDQRDVERLKRFKKAARKRLIKKLTGPDGKSHAIYVLKPIDYSKLQDAETVNSIIRKAIKAYDKKIEVREAQYALTGITLEQFRLAMASLKAEILVVTVIYPTNIDLYMYDKRTPYQIYAHSEAISGAAQLEFTKEAAVHYTKILVRRALYRYIRNQFYELPRDNIPPVLQSEIPRYIASVQSVEMINREARSSFYGSAAWGSALSTGTNGKYWNSSIFSFEVGYEVANHLFVEAALEMFAYNSTMGSMKYMIGNREKNYKLLLGIGLARVTDRHTLDWDQNNSLLGSHIFVVPSASFLLPISDVYLKAETRLYLGADGKSVITLMPGLFVRF